MSRPVDALPLPDRAYIPGEIPRHDETAFDWIKQQAHSVTSDTTAKQNIAWLYGLRLIENKFYWEAHEVLEEVWMNAPPNSRERLLVQGIIHIANAALKTNMMRPDAAKRLSLLAKECITEAFTGLNGETLMTLQVQQCLQASKQSCTFGFQFQIQIDAL